jgi:hypothetical protein
MAKKKAMKRAHPRHCFESEMDMHDGEPPKVLKYWTKVKPARLPVDIALTKADVMKSLDVGGCGNTTCCAMAQSVKRQKNVFPHPYAGFVDWLYKTAYVVSRVDKNGIPIECVKYEHRDDIAPLFDKRNERELIKRIDEAGGKIVVHLQPARHRVGESNRGGNVKARGLRTRAPGGQGANKRIATMMAGRGVTLKRLVDAGAQVVES